MYKLLYIIFYPIIYVLYVILISLYLILTPIIFYIISSIISCITFSQKKDLNFYYMAKFLFYIIKHTIGAKINIEGTKNIPDNTNFIVASNHQSSGDIAALSYTFKKNPIFLAKKSLFYTPLIFALKGAQCIPINKKSNSLKELRTLYENCNDRLSKKKTIILFPEGTRNNTSRNIKFKPGIFYIAKNTNSIVLPISHNASDVMGKNLFCLPKKRTATIKIMSPLDPNKMSKDDFLFELQNIINTNTNTLHANFIRSQQNK